MKQNTHYFQLGQDDDSDSTGEDVIIQQPQRGSTTSKRTSLITDKSPTTIAQAASNSNTKQFKNQESTETEGDVDEFDDDENNSLWMTSTQFSQLLDKQEALENLGYTLANKKKKSKQEAKVCMTNIHYHCKSPFKIRVSILPLRNDLTRFSKIHDCKF